MNRPYEAANVYTKSRFSKAAFLNKKHSCINHTFYNFFNFCSDVDFLFHSARRVRAPVIQIFVFCLVVLRSVNMILLESDAIKYIT